jgi:DNA-binding response OmpR family regulator
LRVCFLRAEQRSVDGSARLRERNSRVHAPFRASDVHRASVYNMTHILIIGDDSRSAESLRAALILEGFDTTIAKANASGLAKIRGGRVDVVILDGADYRADGYRLLRRIRDIDMDAPVLMLNKSSSEADKVRALRMGADDYLIKPIGVDELLARIETIMRRRGRSDPVASERIHPIKTVIRHFGNIAVNIASLQVWRDGTPVSLRPKEMDLLLALIEREGRVVSRQELLECVWGYEREVSSRTVDNHVAKLRLKLEDDRTRPNHIISVRTKGYRFQSEPASKGSG